MGSNHILKPIRQIMKPLFTTQLPTRMTFGRCPKIMCRFVFFLSAFALMVISMTLCASRVYAVGEPSPTYSLEARGEHLGEIIQKLAEMSGYEISLDPNWEAMPVSISIRNVTLYEGLNLLLSRINTAIVIDMAEKKCSIMIFDSFADHQSNTFGASDIETNSADANENTQNSLLSENTIDPLDMEVTPPSVSGEKGITLRELAELEKNQNQLDDENREIIPPKKSGEKGITARELAEIEKHQNQIDPKNMEVIPPTKPGEKGITLRELIEIQNIQQQINTESSVGLPPKITQKKKAATATLEEIERFRTTEKDVDSGR